MTSTSNATDQTRLALRDSIQRLADKLIDEIEPATCCFRQTLAAVCLSARSLAVCSAKKWTTRPRGPPTCSFSNRNELALASTNPLASFIGRLAHLKVAADKAQAHTGLLDNCCCCCCCSCCCCYILQCKCVYLSIFVLLLLDTGGLVASAFLLLATRLRNPCRTNTHTHKQHSNCLEQST